MEEISVNSSLEKEDLFGLFRAQLKKDFESSGLDAAFTDTMPSRFEELKKVLAAQMAPLLHHRSSLLHALLYRIDISEGQLKNYQYANSSLSFEDVLAELIIKRILQKVILKRSFSA